jgi:hypothetical protein
MSLIDRVNSACVKARRDGKFSFTIECADWEPIYRFMAAEETINRTLAEQEEALKDLT